MSELTNHRLDNWQFVHSYHWLTVYSSRWHTNSANKVDICSLIHFRAWSHTRHTEILVCLLHSVTLSCQINTNTVVLSGYLLWPNPGLSCDQCSCVTRTRVSRGLWLNSMPPCHYSTHASPLCTIDFPWVNNCDVKWVFSEAQEYCFRFHICGEVIRFVKIQKLLLITIWISVTQHIYAKYNLILKEIS